MSWRADGAATFFSFRFFDQVFAPCFVAYVFLPWTSGVQYFFWCLFYEEKLRKFFPELFLSELSMELNFDGARLWTV